MSAPTLQSRRAFLKTSTAAAGIGIAGGLAAGGHAPGAESTGPTPGHGVAQQQARPAHRGKRASPAASKGCPPEIRAALRGPWPSVRTPFTQQGKIDFAGLRRHLDFMIDEGKAKAIVLTWGDSLYSLLTDDEIAEVTKAVVQHVDHRAFVVAADNSWWTGKTVEFAEYCVRVGANMLMVKPPDWAHSTTVESLVDHYRAVSEKIPVMLVTNYLGKRGDSFGLEVIQRLRDHLANESAAHIVFECHNAGYLNSVHRSPILARNPPSSRI